MYAKNLTASKGVDNVILIQFLNQDQKPVDIANSTFTFRIISQDGQDLLISKDMVNLQIGSGATATKKGQATVTLTSGELDAVESQRANYSVEHQDSSSLYRAVYVDDNAGARGVITIKDSVFPAFVASTAVTVPDQVSGVEYTSTIETKDNSTTTIQITPTAFTGTVQVQGAVDTANTWYDIGSALTYTSSSTRGYTNVTGFHPRLRLKITTTSGSIGSVVYR